MAWPVKPHPARASDGFIAAAPALPALGYLLALTLAESLTVWLSPQVGMLYHILFLLLLLVHAASIWRRPGRDFFLALAFVPLIRVVSLSLPLTGFPLLYWYLLAGIPLFSAVLVYLRLVALPWRSAVSTPKGWPLQLLVGLTGIGFGAVEYYILRPASLVESFTWSRFLGAAMVLLLCTGYLEELIFRRLLQQAAVRWLGRLPGILYVALLFAILHLGYRSFADLLFVFIVGLCFGLIVDMTGSLLGVSLAHGLTNIFLFLILPFLAANGSPGAPAVARPIPFTAAEALPLRAGPHATYPLETIIQPDSQAQIMGRDETGRWLLIAVQSTEVTGWLPSDMIAVPGSHGPMPILRSPPPQVSVPGPGLALRTGPGPDFPALVHLAAGRYTLVGRDTAGGWLQVGRPSGLSGWIPAGDATIHGDPAAVQAHDQASGNAPRFAGHGGWLLGMLIGALGLLALWWKKGN